MNLRLHIVVAAHLGETRGPSLAEWVTLDSSQADHSVADTVLPHATQGADRFHVVRVANDRLDQVRRRVQDETLSHRRRKSNAYYRTRWRLVIADERLDGSST